MARQINKFIMTEAAERLGVSQPTLSAWEGERKSPSIDKLESMADIYHVTTDFLLGRSTQEQPPMDKTIPVSQKAVNTMHGKPVWSPKFGWALVNAANGVLVLPDSTVVPISDSGPLYTLPPSFTVGYCEYGEPLSLSEIRSMKRIWIQPISRDSDSNEEHKGWYRICERYAENELGYRFYFDTYAAKWLAFENELE
ncbi:MAG: helix-turn-helix transcriptional regulator [Oscillospiraceae bacterium]